MRTVFVGTSDFAVTVLERLAASAHRPELVITRPDRRRGRGQRLTSPPVARAARALELELAQPDSINADEAVEQVAALDPDAVCVCAYGGLIKEPLLSAHLMLNVHPSLLPRWRGAAPIERAIMAGDELTGASIMRLTAGLDSGPVCAQAPEPIGPTDTFGTLSERLARLGGELLLDVLDREPPYRAQDEALVTYAEKISSADRQLDPSRTAIELERVVRALTPHIGAWIEVEGDRLGVLRAKAIPEEANGATPEEVHGELPAVRCADGYLLLEVVKPAGRHAMSGADWLRGHRR